LNLFEQISVRSDEILYGTVYNTCASLCNERSITLGNKIFHQMPKTFLNDIVVVNSLIHMLMKFGQVEDAERLFKQRKKCDLYTYGIIMNGYNINDEPHKCLSLLPEINQQKLIINEPIALSLIGACSEIGIRSTSQKIVQHISHLQNDIHVKNALIDMWVCIIDFVHFN
jgi:pentatricopeptide repeat protein